MKTRQLGTNGPYVAPVGLGCMSFGGMYGPTDEATSHRTLATAEERGFRFLDTADVYGNGVSETVIGNYLKGKKGDWVIATKASIRNEGGRRWFDNSPEHLRTALEGSLKRLGIDHVDLFYIHRREQERPIEDVMETLAKLKEEGKIGGIGLSEIAPYTLRRAQAVAPVMAVQNEYSLWTRLPELGLIQACKELGVAFVPFSSVGRGMLTDIPMKRANMKPSDFRLGNPRFTEPNLSANIAYVDRFRALARDMGLATATLANAWVLAKDDHLIPIPGTRTPEHLLENIAAAEVELTDDQIAEIERILPVGWAHGDRYADAQSIGPERYC
jgi:aryl-alcohol dehydrogenase-like predicted oxidoreductase